MSTTQAPVTTDGATGGVAYYVVLATILVGTNVTTIGSGVITQGSPVQSLAALADGSVTSDKIDWSTIVANGTWTTTESVTSRGSFIQKSIDISSLGFSSADDYVVVLTNRGGATNGWAVALTVTEKTASGFKITEWNAHWSSGAIGSGNVIDWAVFRTTN